VRIIRAKRDTHFTVMANDVIFDDRISYRALGLLTFLLSKPDGWETDSDRLSAGRKEGRDAIRSAMNELKAAGYLRQNRTQDPITGRWSTIGELSDTATTPPDTTEDGFPGPGPTSDNTTNPQVGPTTGFQASAEDGFPGLGATSANTTSPQVGPTTGKPTVGFPGPTSKNGDKELPRTEGSPRKRGTRLPDDFHVTPEMVAWAREHTPDIDGRASTATFIDYWRAKTGKDATKLDWEATWRNWLRKDQAAIKPSSRRANTNGHRAYRDPVDQSVYDLPVA